MSYSILFPDCPWRFKNWSMKELTERGEKWARRNGRSPYPVMTTEDICRLPIGDIAAKHSVLLLWATAPKMEDAFTVIKAWGFRYVTRGFTWVKLNPSGIGWHFGLGYHCLDANGKVYIQNQSGQVEELTIEQLYKRNESCLLIHTHQGWRQLKTIWSNGLKPTVLLKHRFGKIGCTLNHRWAIKSLSTPRKPDGSRQRIHQISYETVDWLNQKANLKIYQGNTSLNLIWSTTPVVSQQPETRLDGFNLDYETGWLIGLYAAEGSCQKNQIRFALHSDEGYMVEHLSQIVTNFKLSQDRYFNYPVKVRRHKIKNQNAQAAYFSSRRIKSLIKTFVEGEDATCKRLVLTKFLQMTIEFRQGFIDGLLAGDGTKNKSPELYGLGYKGFLGLSSASEQLILDTRNLLRSMGVMSIIDPAEDKQSPYSGADCKTYHLRFPHPRNQNLWLNGRHVLPVRYDGLEAGGLIRPTFDLSVEDETFVVDGLVSHNTRQNVEDVLIAVRGKGVKRVHNDVSSLVIYPRGQHSAKPPEVRDRIVRLYGDLPRIELFARSATPGWDVWGNEVDCSPGAGPLMDYISPPAHLIVDEDEFMGLPPAETVATFGPNEQIPLMVNL